MHASRSLDLFWSKKSNAMKMSEYNRSQASKLTRLGACMAMHTWIGYACTSVRMAWYFRRGARTRYVSTSTTWLVVSTASGSADGSKSWRRTSDHGHGQRRRVHVHEYMKLAFAGLSQVVRGRPDGFAKLLYPADGLNLLARAVTLICTNIICWAHIADRSLLDQTSRQPADRCWSCTSTL